MKPGESAPPGILVTFRRNGEQFAGLIEFALGDFLGAEPSKMATIGNRRDSWRIRVTHENLAALAEGAFDRLGDYENLIFEGKSYSSGELLDRARRAGSGLSKLGVEPGDRVVVLMANCPEVAITYNAIWRAGAVVTPVVFLISPPELTHILADSGAVAVVTSPELLVTVSLAAADAPALRFVIVAGGVPEPGVLPAHVRGINFADVEAAPPGELTAVGGDDLAALMYTGGTTGRAKGVMLESPQPLRMLGKLSRRFPGRGHHQKHHAAAHVARLRNDRDPGRLPRHRARNGGPAALVRSRRFLEAGDAAPDRAHCPGPCHDPDAARAAA